MSTQDLPPPSPTPWPSPGPPPVPMPSDTSPSNALTYTTISGVAFAGFVGVAVLYFLYEFCLRRMCCPQQPLNQSQPTGGLQRWGFRRRVIPPEAGAPAGLGVGPDRGDPTRGVPASVVGTFPVKAYVSQRNRPVVSPAIEPMSRMVRSQRMLAAQTSLWTKWRRPRLPAPEEDGDRDLPPHASAGVATPMSSAAATGPQTSSFSIASLDGVGPAPGGTGGGRGGSSLARSLMLRMGGAPRPAAAAAPAGAASHVSSGGGGGGGPVSDSLRSSNSSGRPPPRLERDVERGVDGDDCSSSFIALDIAPDADKSLAAAQRASRFAGGNRGSGRAQTPSRPGNLGRPGEDNAGVAASALVEVVPGDVDLPTARAVSFFEKPTCPICLCEFVDGDLFRQLPCQHEFHRECIDSWMDTHRTCPLCRLTLWEQPPSY